jgi:hypothetical protein
MRKPIFGQANLIADNGEARIAAHGSQWGHE